MNEFVARNGLIALDSSSISGPLTLNGRLSSSNSADTTFSQGSRLVEILTTSNGQYSIRSTQAIKAEGYYFANSTGNIYAFNGDNLIHFNSSNNIGIGTTNPTAKLDVRGNTFISGSLTIRNNNGLILYDRTGDFGPGRIYTQYNYALGEIFIEASGSQAPTVFSPNGGVSIGGQSATSPVRGLFVSGSVGIGAPSPGATLHVSGSILSSGPNAFIYVNSTSITSTVDINGADTSTNFIGVSINSDTLPRWRVGIVAGRKFYIQPATGGGSFASTPAITILSGSGNVGISNTNPAEALDVTGNIIASGNVGIGTTSPTARLDVSGSLRVTGNSNFTSPITASAPTNGDNAILIKNISGGNVIQLRNNGTAVFNDSVTMPYLTGVGGVILSPISIIFGTDFVTYPSAKLHVSSSTAASVFRIDTAAGPGTLFVSGSGNVGIGTTSPSTKLEVSGDNNANIVRLTSTSNLGTTLWAGVTSHDIQFNYTDGSSPGIYSAIRIIGNSESGLPDGGTVKSDFTIWTGGYQIPLAERLRITAQGNVGIGITSASAALHVSGSAIISNNLTVTGSILTTGNVTIRGQYLFFGGPLSVNAILTDGVLNQESLVYRSGLLPTSTNMSDHAFSNGQGDIAITSGTRNLVSLARGFNPSSGTGVYNFLSITGTISQSNATGISRGIHVAPTITNAANYRAIQWDNNSGWGLYGNGSAASYFGGALAVGGTNVFATIHAQGNTATSTTQTFLFSQPNIVGTLTNLYAIRSNIVGGGSGTITNAYHYSLRQSTLGGSVITNQYGYYCEDLPSATNNYGFYGEVTAATGRWNLYMAGTANNYLAGNLGIGVVNPTNIVEIRKDQNTSTILSIINAANTTGSRSVISVGGAGEAISIASIQSNFTQLANWASRGVISTDSGVTNGILLTTTVGPIAFRPGNITGTDTMVVTGSNVGIGTTSPIYSLDILSPTGTEPLTTNTDNYAARIKRTYTNTSGSVSSRRYNTFFDTTYTGNQAYTNVTGLYNYINYQNTNANSVISGIVSYIEPVSNVSASSLISFAAQVGTGGSITSVTGYNSNLLSLTAGTTTNARLFRAEALGSTNTVTNLYGFIAESTLTSATNNYGFYGNIAAATGRWNLYMNGTANNYLAGNLGIGVTSPLDRLHVDLNNNQYAYFGGADQTAGVLRGIRFGYGQSGPYYWKSAIIQEQTGDGAARGKIHILNNNQFGINNASLSDARITILASGEVGINNQSPVFRLDVSGSFRASGSITATSGSDYFDISHDITQPAQTGSQIYEVNITPTLRYTAPNQTQTALRVAATFSGSTALSSSQSNIIADFGSTSAGSQLVINDTTSGSIYMVNDVSGLPIIEANSNWDVFIYDYPNVVLKKTGSTIEVSGSLRLNGSSLDTAWTSYTPQWTAAVTNPVLNNGTITGAYKLIGKTCFVRVRLVIGSTTTLGSGQWYFSLPFSASIASGIQFPCSILDNGNAWYQGTVNGEYGGFTDKTAIIGQSSGSNSSQGITETFPIAWGTSDSLQFNGSYEIA